MVKGPGVLQGTMDTWSLQSHSINASLDQLFKSLSLHVLCLVRGETDASFPRGKKKATGKKEMADRQRDNFCFNFPSFVFFFSPLWITVLSLLVFWAIDLCINLNSIFFLFPNIHLENTLTPDSLVLVRPTAHFQIDLPRESGVIPWLESHTGIQESWALFPGLFTPPLQRLEVPTNLHCACVCAGDNCR